MLLRCPAVAAGRALATTSREGRGPGRSRKGLYDIRSCYCIHMCVYISLSLSRSLYAYMCIYIYIYTHMYRMLHSKSYNIIWYFRRWRISLRRWLAPWVIGRGFPRWKQCYQIAMFPRWKQCFLESDPRGSDYKGTGTRSSTSEARLVKCANCLHYEASRRTVHNILYYTIPYYTIPYHTILDNTILSPWRTTQDDSVMGCAPRNTWMASRHSRECSGHRRKSTPP